jgi:starch phosphorylase
LDGWWDEAYNGENGWAIGAGEDYTDVADPVYQDSVENKALYQLLEDIVVPTFYKRALDGHSKGWIEMMKSSMMTNCAVYNTNRMVQEYVSKFYITGAESFEKLSQDDFSGAKDLASWKKKIKASWDKIKVLDVKEPLNKELIRDDEFSIEALVDLGKLAPEDVVVSVYYGHMDFYGDNIIEGKEIVMNPMEQDGTIYKYSCFVKCDTPGKFGYAVRVMASRENLVSRFHFGKVKWEYSY